MDEGAPPKKVKTKSCLSMLNVPCLHVHEINTRSNRFCFDLFYFSADLSLPCVFRPRSWSRVAFRNYRSTRHCHPPCGSPPPPTTAPLLFCFGSPCLLAAGTPSLVLLVCLGNVMSSSRDHGPPCTPTRSCFWGTVCYTLLTLRFQESPLSVLGCTRNWNTKHLDWSHNLHCLCVTRRCVRTTDLNL